MKYKLIIDKAAEEEIVATVHAPSALTQQIENLVFSFSGSDSIMGCRDDEMRKLTFSGLYLAIAMVLPFVTGQIPEIGAMLCPMHIPALLCGFMCGWPWGVAVGFIAPLLRGTLFGMPALFPTAVAMAFELAVYGGMAGYLYAVLPRKKWTVYPALVIAMIAGRLVWGLVRFVLAGLAGSEFSLAMFLAGAVTGAIPGIILQLVLIPALILAMNRANLSLNRQINRKQETEE